MCNDLLMKKNFRMHPKIFRTGEWRSKRKFFYMAFTFEVIPKRICDYEKGIEFINIKVYFKLSQTINEAILGVK